ncbi:MAG: hypothetical protein ACTSVZ_03435 [Promethearchaeota archaeon]
MLPSHEFFFSLDPSYYYRFAQESSPSLRIFLRENLPRTHRLISLIDKEVTVPLNRDLNLVL